MDTDSKRLLPLRVMLILAGIAFIPGLSLLIAIWPAGWAWGHGHSHHLAMLLGVYAVLGVYLLLAVRDPHAHRSLIWFTVWSSVVHAGIMFVQALTDPMERGHLIGDAPILLVLAIALAMAMKRSEPARS
jgi:hypothetical protein